MSKPKQDSARAGRKTQHSATPTMEEANVANPLDATLLQAMMDSLKSDIFGKIDALSTSLPYEISSLRQKFKSLIEPIQCMVEAHEVAVNELERAANDHSAKISDLEAAVGTLTSKVKRLEEKHEELEGRSRRNNIRIIGVPEGMEGPHATDFVAQLLQDVLKLTEKPPLDRAHRSGRAGETSLLFRGKRISIFLDYTD